MRSLAIRSVLGAVVLVGGSAAYFVACGGGETTADGGPDAQTTDQNSSDVAKGDGGSNDASVDSSAEAEAGPACNPANPFSTPSVLASLNVIDAGNTRGAHLSNDYLTAYYEYGALLYSATRTAPSGDTFTSPTELSSLNSDAGTSSNPTLSPDQLTIYFASDRSGTSQIYFATRVSVTAAFGNPALVTGLPSAPVSAPFVQGDGSSLYFVATVPDAGTSNDIYRATINGPGSLSNPVAVTELNTSGSDGPVGVTADGLTAYFSRLESPDGGAAAHFKIWKATRSSTSLPFSNLVGVVELEGPDTVNDDMAWVSNDGCQITLSSFRLPGSNIFIANK